MLAGCLYAVTPAHGQVPLIDPFDLKITAHGGLHLGEEGPLCFANTDSDVSVLALGLQVPIFGPLEARASVSYYAAGWKPWPDLDIFDVRGLASGSALAFTLEAVITLPVAPRVYIEPLAGFGVNRVRRRDRDEEIADANIIAAAATPQLTYGSGVGVKLTDRLDLHVQARGVTLLVGDQEFIRPTAIEGDRLPNFSADVGSLTSLQVDAGFAIRI